MNTNNTIRHIVISFLLFGFVPALLAADARITKIQIFTTLNKKPLISTQTKVPVEVYYLDEGQKILDNLNEEYAKKTQNMSVKEKQRIYSQIRFKDSNGRYYPFAQRMIRSDEGIALAARQGIKKVPAIVFNDGLAVVYGELSVGRAIERFKAWAQQ